MQIIIEPVICAKKVTECLHSVLPQLVMSIKSVRIACPLNLLDDFLFLYILSTCCCAKHVYFVWLRFLSTVFFREMMLILKRI